MRSKATLSSRNCGGGWWLPYSLNSISCLTSANGAEGKGARTGSEGWILCITLSLFFMWPKTNKKKAHIIYTECYITLIWNFPPSMSEWNPSQGVSSGLTSCSFSGSFAGFPLPAAWTSTGAPQGAALSPSPSLPTVPCLPGGSHSDLWFLMHLYPESQIPIFGS